MFYTKDCLGESILEEFATRYFIIKKDSFYGIEIEQNSKEGITCESEYFTENKEVAYTLGQKMQMNSVAPIHLADIIDDFIQ